MGLKVGLDFGTSNSGVAISDGDGVHLLPLDPGNQIPEVVKTILYISRDQKSYIGQEAIALYYEHNVNRLRRYEKRQTGVVHILFSEVDYWREVFVDVDILKPGRLLQYLKTALRKSGGISDVSGTWVFDQYFSVGELIQIYFEHLKRKAEEIIGETITGVTLGRPVKFSEDPELDRQAEAVMREAALNAGFKDVDFELEPIAAALFYEKTLDQPETVLIFDFGGGTLDITIMGLGDPGNRKVYANGGIDIAGSDFDRTIIEKRLLHHFGEGLIQHMPEISELIEIIPDWMALPELSTPVINNTLEQAIKGGIAPVQIQTLQSLIFNELAFPFYNQVESAKMTLSEQGAAVIEFSGKNFDLWELYTRTQFETDIQDYCQQIETVLLETVKASGLGIEQIDAVVKTGGSSSIPLFSAMLGRIFGAEKVKHSNAFSSVTAGLAIRASEK